MQYQTPSSWNIPSSNSKTSYIHIDIIYVNILHTIATIKPRARGIYKILIGNQVNTFISHYCTQVYQLAYYGLIPTQPLALPHCFAKISVTNINFCDFKTNFAAIHFFSVHSISTISPGGSGNVRRHFKPRLVEGASHAPSPSSCLLASP